MQYFQAPYLLFNMDASMHIKYDRLQHDHHTTCMQNANPISSYTAIFSDILLHHLQASHHYHNTHGILYSGEFLWERNFVNWRPLAKFSLWGIVGAVIGLSAIREFFFAKSYLEVICSHENSRYTVVLANKFSGYCSWLDLYSRCNYIFTTDHKYSTYTHVKLYRIVGNFREKTFTNFANQRPFAKIFLGEN